MQAPISAFDVETLINHFRQVVPRPRWKPWLAAVDDAIQVEVHGIKIPKAREIFRRLTEGGRYTLAAWKWIRPNQPVPGIEELAGIQALAGLSHVEARTFASRLTQVCKEIIREHPRLEKWVLLRIAALEYVTHPIPAALSSELRDVSIRLRMSLLQAQHLCWQVPREAVRLAHQIARGAMEGAAQAVVEAFGAREGALSTTLMIPVPGTTVFAPNEVARENARRAAELWEGLDFDRQLLIVAESRGARHLGFWVPLARGAGEQLLPGAPTAFDHGEGAAVFKDDLPRLVGFPAAVEARWRAFMTERFRGQLFVSLPFRAPDDVGGHVTPGVLNVTVDTPNVSPWRRAYHAEWLTVARDRVQPFVEIAFGALMVILRAAGNEAPRLATGSEAWDTMPTVLPPLLTEGGHDESG